jgi:hypothetical protein
MTEEIEGDVKCELAPPATRKPSRARTLTDIRSLARGHTRTALRVLVGIMRSEDATPAARAAAANAILDRGWGKAAQPLESGEEGEGMAPHRIERVLVEPERASSDGTATDA